jgi:hypothetical protein
MIGGKSAVNDLMVVIAAATVATVAVTPVVTVAVVARVAVYVAVTVMIAIAINATAMIVGWSPVRGHNAILWSRKTNL